MQPETRRESPSDRISETGLKVAPAAAAADGAERPAAAAAKIFDAAIGAGADEDPVHLDVRQ